MSSPVMDRVWPVMDRKLTGREMAQARVAAVVVWLLVLAVVFAVCPTV